MIIFLYWHSLLLINFKVQMSDLSISTVTFPFADSLTALKCSSLLFSLPRKKRQKVNKTQKTWSKTAVTESSARYPTFLYRYHDVFLSSLFMVIREAPFWNVLVLCWHCPNIFRPPPLCQNRGERILFFGPNTNNIRNQNFDRIRIRIIFVFFQNERIRIRIIFMHKYLAEYEYE